MALPSLPANERCIGTPAEVDPPISPRTKGSKDEIKHEIKEETQKLDCTSLKKTCVYHICVYMIMHILCKDRSNLPMVLSGAISRVLQFSSCCFCRKFQLFTSLNRQASHALHGSVPQNATCKNPLIASSS